MTDIKLGINNCFAAKRWPEPEEWCRIIKEELDLQYVQFSYDLLDPRTSQPARSRMSKRIRKLAKEYDLDIHTTFGGLAFYSYNQILHPDPMIRKDAIRSCEQAILMTSEMGARGTGGPLGALSMKDLQDPRRRQSLTEQLFGSLHYLAELAGQEEHKFLLWEPTPLARELSHTIEETRDFYIRANQGSAVPILLCLDCGHQCAADISGKDRDPYQWIKELGSLSPVMHIQQTDGVLDSHWPFTKEYNQKGIIKVDKMIRAIQDSGAEEVILFLEIIHPFEEDEAKVLNDIKESVSYWKNSMKENNYLKGK